MFKIAVILGSVRRGRQSERVAKFIVRKLSGRSTISVELLDLREFNFPIMEERLAYRDDPPPRLEEFSQKIRQADALVLVSPEYNNGYPGVLKNALDYLYEEYERKPFGLVTVSAGGYAGMNCLAQLKIIVLALGGIPVPETLSVSKVQDAFSEDGSPRIASYEKRAEAFVDELLWFTEAIADRKKKEQSA